MLNKVLVAVACLTLIINVALFYVNHTQVRVVIAPPAEDQGLTEAERRLLDQSRAMPNDMDRRPEGRLMMPGVTH